ncbi:hypothetical protein A2875_01785 [Candidatus Gottesmanbacteria bacterium RIFCSPHIGHO2_01_FULL_46_14]|uniref:Uncharacterized protein n=2 Tax=Candidatus Gottesmaniibacteriota TaxID=1752720 RepID=A0A1F5ZIW7_9BACT|nr:MAG: hypothetical protein A2875_01785 [Candidatus Gottesmanbacteria bacterium RIFCSPHIGHO2_01_FULL_46_14]OGG29762.1 MAG: hypothetical protein A2971_00705 [Candidatus Gottesmanbacteria bacterium RIFCSPLOWO2_01_FULL_46_21]
MAEGEGGLLGWIKRKFDRTPEPQSSKLPGLGPQGEHPLTQTRTITDQNEAFMRGQERAMSGGRSRGDFPEIGIDPTSYPEASGPSEPPSQN